MPSDDQVRELVRMRDGRCTECGVGAVEYLEQTGRRLDVHRKEQGPYTLDNCVSVCETCHHNVQKVWGRRSARPANSRTVTMFVTESESRDLDVAAARCRMSTPGFLRALVVAAINDWPEVQAKVKAAAERLAAAELPEGRRRPGRPIDPPPPEPKKRKGR